MHDPADGIIATVLAIIVFLATGMISAEIKMAYARSNYASCLDNGGQQDKCIAWTLDLR